MGAAERERREERGRPTCVYKTMFLVGMSAEARESPAEEWLRGQCVICKGYDENCLKYTESRRRDNGCRGEGKRR